MTSKISFFKLMKEDIKRKLWLPVLSVLVFFISFPIVLMVFLDNIKRYESYFSVEEQAREMFLILMGYRNIWMFLITIVGATLCGIFAFSYLYKKKKVDFYHSIPVRREKLFLVSYLDGILFYLIPYLVTILLCLLIGGFYFSIDSALLGMVLKEFGVQFLYYLLFYHVAILASVLAGNMFGCLFLNGIAQCYMILVYGIFNGYCSSYFDTYVDYGAFGESIAGFSPLVSFATTLEHLMGENSFYMFRLKEGEVSVPLSLMQCFLVSVLLFGLSLYLYKIRSSEMSGKAIAFLKIQPVVRILLVIPSAMTGGWIFENLTNKTGWMLFGILFGAVLVHGTIEVLYQSDIRKIFSHKIQLAGTIIAAAAVALILRNDWLGYDAYVPKLEQIESAAVQINGLAESGFYEFENANGEMDRISSYLYKMEKMNLTGEMLPVVYQLMNLGVETGKNKEVLKNEATFEVKVRLKGGREVLRRYRVSLDKAYDLFRTVFQSQEYKEKTYAYLFQNQSRIEELEIRGLSNEWQEISEENRAEFLEIYQKELLEVSLDDMRDYPVIGLLMCNVPEGSTYTELILLPTMKESLAYLEGIGALDSNIYWVHPKAEHVLYLQIGGWKNEGAGGEDEESESREYKRIRITDKALMEKLFQKLYFSTGWNASLLWRGYQDENNYDYDYDVSLVFDSEISQEYFEREEKWIDLVFRGVDQETMDLLRKLVQEYQEEE